MTSLIDSFVTFLTTPISQFFGAAPSDGEQDLPPTAAVAVLGDAKSEVLRLLSFQANLLSELASSPLMTPANTETTASDVQALTEALSSAKAEIERSDLVQVPHLLETSRQLMANADVVRSQLLMRVEGLTRTGAAVDTLRQQLQQTLAKVEQGEHHALGEWQSRFEAFKVEVAALKDSMLSEGTAEITAYFQRPAIAEAVGSNECQADVHRAKALIDRIDDDLDCIVLDLTRRYERQLGEVAQLLAGKTLQEAHDYIAQCHAALDAQTKLDLHLPVPEFARRDGIAGTRSPRPIARIRSETDVRVRESNPIWRVLGTVVDDLGYKTESRTVTRYRVELGRLHEIRKRELREHLDAINEQASAFTDTAVRATFDSFHENVRSQLTSLQGALWEAASRHEKDQRTIRGQVSTINAFCMDLDDQLKDAQSLARWLHGDQATEARHVV